MLIDKIRKEIGFSENIEELKGKYDRYKNLKEVEFYGLSLPELYVMHLIKLYAIYPTEKEKSDYHSILETGFTLLSRDFAVVLRDFEKALTFERVETFSIYEELIKTVGSVSSALFGTFLRGLAYNIYSCIASDECPLDKKVLGEMLNILAPYTGPEIQAPPKFKLNVQNTFSEVVLRPTKYMFVKVNRVKVEDIEGSLQDLHKSLENRINELQLGIDYIDMVLMERYKSKILDKTEVKGQSEYFREVVHELLMIGANLVEEYGRELKFGGREEWALKDYLERYRGFPQPMEITKRKVEICVEDMDKDFKVDKESKGLTSLDTKSERALESLREKLIESLEIESAKKEYVDYLIGQGLFDKSLYFVKLA